MDDNSYNEFDEIMDSMELYNSKPQRICSIFVYFVFSTIIIFLICSCFIRVEQYEKIQGRINNRNVEVSVVSNEVGVIEKINVSNGQAVKKGDIIVSIKKDHEMQNYKYYRQKVDDMNEKKSMCYMYLMYLKGQNTQWTEYSANKYFNEFDSRKKLIESQCSNMNDIEKKTYYEAEITKVYTEKEEFNNQYAEYKKMMEQAEYEIDNMQIVASKDGILEFSSDICEGNCVNVGQQVATITSANENDYIIQAYVDETEVVNLKRNMKIKFDMNAYPAKKYGYIEGKITDIADKALVNEVTGCNYFVVQIKVDDINKLSNKDDEVVIKSGMSGTVKVLTSKKKIIFILLDKFNVSNN